MKVTLPDGMIVEDIGKDELDVLLSLVAFQRDPASSIERIFSQAKKLVDQLFPSTPAVEETEIDCEIVEEEDDVEEVEDAAASWPGMCGEMNMSFFPVPCTLAAGHDGRHSCLGVWSWGNE